MNSVLKIKLNLKKICFYKCVPVTLGRTIDSVDD